MMSHFPRATRLLGMVSAAAGTLSFAVGPPRRPYLLADFWRVQAAADIDIIDCQSRNVARLAHASLCDFDDFPPIQPVGHLCRQCPGSATLAHRRSSSGRSLP